MKKSVLFVCLGNICRSPSAEAVFQGLVDREGLSDQFSIDSAGTSAYHAGEPADRRMQSHAVRRGINLTSISRGFNASSDFDEFDIIVAMDDSNFYNLQDVARTDEDQAKIVKMTDYCSRFNYDHVPDPYYGGAEGFELVLDLLEDACEGLLNELR
ncbi:low molecular weight phosphotyrosine protein phosphatase [Puteibacter caeruleilacunae]|nr:low molecular weight phosphotyrosine protein phosphatase [Puteibacter caeruleilacunae]